MARPIDWSPLAETDPVPGDPAEVSELARRYRETAQAISTAARKLRSIASTDGWVGKAAIEFRDQALSVADSIERAHDRYDETGEALRDFQPDHDEAQRLSAQALTDAKDAEAEERRAQSLYDTEAAKPEPDEALLTTYDQRIRQAQGDLAQARTRLDNAVDNDDGDPRIGADRQQPGDGGATHDHQDGECGERRPPFTWRRRQAVRGHRFGGRATLHSPVLAGAPTISGDVARIGGRGHGSRRGRSVMSHVFGRQRSPGRIPGRRRSP